MFQRFGIIRKRKMSSGPVEGNFCIRRDKGQKTDDKDQREKGK
jgi:hypothetical protein